MGEFALSLGVFLQSRLDSSRLPRKALLPIGSKTLTEWALETLKKIPAQCHVLLTTEESREELAPLAVKCGFEVFVGPRDHVLERFVRAARAFHVRTILRATGDNPLVSLDLALETLARHQKMKADYTAFQGAPVGVGVEAVEAKSLVRAFDGQPNGYEKEHVCPYLYNRPQEFHLETPQVPLKWQFPQGRVTVDTLEDYENLLKLYEAFTEHFPPSLDALCPWLQERGKEGCRG